MHGFIHISAGKKSGFFQRSLCFLRTFAIFFEMLIYLLLILFKNFLFYAHDHLPSDNHRLLIAVTSASMEALMISGFTAAPHASPPSGFVIPTYAMALELELFESACS